MHCPRPWPCRTWARGYGRWHWSERLQLRLRVVRVVVRIVLQCRRARSIKAEEYVNFDVLDGAQNDFDDDKSGISHFGLV